MQLSEVVEKKAVSNGFCPKTVETFFRIARRFLVDYPVLRKAMKFLRRKKAGAAIFLLKIIGHDRGGIPLPPSFVRVYRLIYAEIG